MMSEEVCLGIWMVQVTAAGASHPRRGERARIFEKSNPSPEHFAKNCKRQKEPSCSVVSPPILGSLGATRASQIDMCGQELRSNGCANAISNSRAMVLDTVEKC